MTTETKKDDDIIETKMLEGAEAKPEEKKSPKKTDDTNFITLVAILGAFAILLSFVAMTNVWGNKSEAAMTDRAIINTLGSIKAEQDYKINKLTSDLRNVNEKVAQMEGDTELKMRAEIDSFMADPKAKAYIEKKLETVVE